MQDRFYTNRPLAAFAAALILCPMVSAQGSTFQTPGMPSQGYANIENSQTTRFSSEFNPALSFVVDGVGDWLHSDSDQDGFSTDLRALELGGQAWVDPKAWAYFIAATDGEALNVEEAAIHYIGLSESTTIRAGRFFIDFGKQMQTHVHELRTIERPLVLRAYLGEEVKGDGVQWDDWRPIGDATAVRWSIGAFSSLLPEENEFAPEDLTLDVADRKTGGDLNFTARVTGFSDLNDSSTLQVGASARLIPSYNASFETTGDSKEDLSNSVYGADLTYGWIDETGQRRLTLGGEYLLDTGDTGVNNSGAGIVDVVTEDVGGFFAFADYEWDRYNSAGLQYSMADLPDGSSTTVTEAELYYSHSFSEFQRLRLGLISATMEDGPDSVRFAVQYTAVLGAHGHGVNW